MTEHRASVALKTAVPPTVSGLRLQRKCACGTQTPAGGECESCAHKRVQRKSGHGPAIASIPASVQQVLGSAGVPLEPHARRSMEAGFGHDFSHVRVHADQAAVRSAEALHAAAYTVGAHVVFGEGRYVPSITAGKRLLAHELTHVIQQGGRASSLQRSSIGGLQLGAEDDALEREADATAERVMRGEQVAVATSSEPKVQRVPAPRQPAIVGLDPAGPEADLSGGTEDRLWQCMKNTPGIPLECPQAPLTWSNYPVARGAGGLGANTGWNVKDKPMEPRVAACVRNILGWSQEQTHVFQATFVRGTAWVQPQFANPANVAATGCNGPVRQCARHFAARPPRGRTLGDFTYSAAAGGACPASAAPATVTATSSADCHLIGDECTRTAVAESARLLRHEQGHMDIACAMARKFNMAIAHGTPFPVLNRNPVAFIQRIQDRYDAQTRHGCLPGPQAAWEGEIASGLPKEPVPQTPPPTPRPRRRRR